VIIWLDAQLSPSLAPWLSEQFGLMAMAVLLRTGEPLVGITAGR
jgi:predicted nuclease of predicted toxin-antitoxin system